MIVLTNLVEEIQAGCNVNEWTRLLFHGRNKIKQQQGLLLG